MEKILSKLKYLHNVFSHFLWSHSQKKHLTIDGYDIQYLEVSKYLLWTAWATGEAFTDGTCIIHQPSKAVMVFLSHEVCASPEFRYTLLHEFIEGHYFLRDKVFAKQNESKLNKLTGYFKGYFSPEVSEAFNKSRVNREHLIALIFELDLAKREMDSIQFNNHLDDIVKNRLQL
jgi:hypothetical protein